MSELNWIYEWQYQCPEWLVSAYVTIRGEGREGGRGGEIKEGGREGEERGSRGIGRGR